MRPGSGNGQERWRIGGSRGLLRLGRACTHHLPPLAACCPGLPCLGSDALLVAHPLFLYPSPHLAICSCTNHYWRRLVTSDMQPALGDLRGGSSACWLDNQVAAAAAGGCPAAVLLLVAARPAFLALPCWPAPPCFM